jgi:hypothetical protein
MFPVSAGTAAAGWPKQILKRQVLVAPASARDEVAV